MPSPSVAINRLDLSLTYQEFSTRASRAGFIGLRVLPGLGVAQEASDFGRVNVESVLPKVEDTERAPRATYSRDTFEWLTDSYSVAEHGVEEVVDDATIERYGDVIRAESIARERAVHRVLQALEAAIADAVFNTTTWTGGSLTTAVGTAWTTQATATPIDDVDAASDAVKASCGVRPNVLIGSWAAIRAIIRTAQVEDLLKYSGRDDPKDLLPGLAQLLRLDQIIVADEPKNTADAGQTAAFGDFWNATMAMVANVRDDGFDGDLESAAPHIGRTIFSTKDGQIVPGDAAGGSESLTMEEYREEARRGGVLRARNKRQVKIIHAQAGHLLTGVTA